MITVLTTELIHQLSYQPCISETNAVFFNFNFNNLLFVFIILPYKMITEQTSKATLFAK